MNVPATFQSASELLLKLRDDQTAAVAQFEWPKLEHFNFALDHFDALAADPAFTNALALHIVGEDGSEVKRTFADLSQRSDQLANHLRGLGVQRGERVLVMLGNELALWETMLALMKLGAVIIPATALLSTEDLRDCFTRGGVKHVVAASAMTDQFVPLNADFTRVAVGAPVEGWLNFDDGQQAPQAFTADAPTLATDPLLLYFTSGTTSKPKLVLHSHQSYPVGHLSTMYWLGLRPGDVHLNISSLHKIIGAGEPLNPEIIDCVRNAWDVFKASDYRISPFELESALIEHPAVVEVAVVPSPDPLRLAVPKAYITLSPDIHPSEDIAKEIFTFSRQRLASYLRVRRIEFVYDLPKTISGKIRRVQLRAQEVERHAASTRGEREYLEEDFFPSAKAGEAAKS